jgi:hypothetical protein
VYKRKIVVKGEPVYNEDGVASAEIKPGYLVAGHASLAHNTAQGADIPRQFAVEREELGRGIDNTRQGLGTGSAYYASGDVVKVAVCYPGCEVTAFVNSGVQVADGDLLTAANDGTLEAVGGGDFPIAQALEAIDVTEVTAVRVRIV